MICCGGKRAQLARVQSTQTRREDHERPVETVARERTAKTFEYIGSGSLTVRGVVSGRTYRFTFPGERIEVAYDDSFAMMAERDVRPASRA